MLKTGDNNSEKGTWIGSKLRTRVPRCLLAHSLASDLSELGGARLLWSDWSETAIFDLSLAGLIMARPHQSHLSKLKSGLAFNLTLDLPTFQSRQTLPLQIVSWNDRYLAGVFDSVVSEGRLHISQEVKDHLILQNWNLSETDNLDLQYRNSFWFHGPFDTNVVLSSDGSGLFEYDGLLLKWDQKGSELLKAAISTEEPEAYSLAWSRPARGKISMGTSWYARGINLLSRIDKESCFENENVHQIFKKACETIGRLK